MLNTTSLNKYLLALIFPAVLSACHDDGYSDSYGYSESHHHSTSHYDEAPEIHTLEIIDTAGYSSIEYPYPTPIIDPYREHGYFEVWWDVSSYDTYSATLYINDYNSLLGAIELDRTQCGPHEGCDYQGFMYCGYSLFDTVSCSSNAYQTPEVDIAELFYDHPDQLYLMLEVCDNYSGYCDSKSQLAIFE